MGLLMSTFFSTDYNYHILDSFVNLQSPVRIPVVYGRCTATRPQWWGWVPEWWGWMLEGIQVVVPVQNVAGKWGGGKLVQKLYMCALVPTGTTREPPSNIDDDTPRQCRPSVVATLLCIITPSSITVNYATFGRVDNANTNRKSNELQSTLQMARTCCDCPRVMLCRHFCRRAWRLTFSNRKSEKFFSSSLKGPEETTLLTHFSNKMPKRRRRPPLISEISVRETKALENGLITSWVKGLFVFPWHSEVAMFSFAT